MKFEIINGEYLGTAEWTGPGRVAVEMEDAAQRAWFERYFSGEDAFLNGLVDCAEMSSERRDASPQAFQRAAWGLAGFAYSVRSAGNGRARKTYGSGG